MTPADVSVGPSLTHHDRNSNSLHHINNSKLKLKDRISHTHTHDQSIDTYNYTHHNFHYHYNYNSNNSKEQSMNNQSKNSKNVNHRSKKTGGKTFKKNPKKGLFKMKLKRGSQQEKRDRPGNLSHGKPSETEDSLYSLDKKPKISLIIYQFANVLLTNPSKYKNIKTSKQINTLSDKSVELAVHKPAQI